jgi:hypothetical protein
VSIVITRTDESTVIAPAQKISNLIVVADEGNEKLLTSVQENESEITVSAAFEEFVAELANAKPAVHVRLAGRFNQIAEREETLDPFVLGQASEAPDDDRVDDQKSTQVVSSAVAQSPT